MRISATSYLIKSLTMVDPKEPVPPVIVTTEDFKFFDMLFGPYPVRIFSNHFSNAEGLIVSR